MVLFITQPPLPAEPHSFFTVLSYLLSPFFNRIQYSLIDQTFMLNDHLNDQIIYLHNTPNISPSTCNALIKFCENAIPYNNAIVNIIYFWIMVLHALHKNVFKAGLIDQYKQAREQSDHYHKIITLSRMMLETGPHETTSALEVRLARQRQLIEMPQHNHH